MHENADSPTALLLDELPARSANPPLPSEGDRSPPRADRAFRHRSVGGPTNRAENIGFGDGARADVVQVAVVRLGDYGVRRAHVLVIREAEQPCEYGVGSPRHAQ